ncbi:MAG: aminopeptidase P family protein [Candidatus Eremiobacteraeota bacterium]|nr:aminopeptidase P family protein [Candidatus Eremiobacteraeota bacterium]
MSLSTRLETVREQLVESKLDTLLVSEPKNRRYLCGFSGSSGWLVITPDRHIVITDGRYWDQVARECPGAELFKFVASDHESLTGALTALLKDKALPQDGRPLGVETNGMTLAAFRDLEKGLRTEGLELAEVEGLVHKMRERKDSGEITLLRKAAEIADEALSAALAEFKPGGKEVELKALIEYEILMRGGAATSFPTIVASGPNGSYPHAGASHRAIQEGEMVTIDFGALYQGYCSDMTRTIWWGRLSDRDKQILGATREAQSLARQAVKAGVEAKALDIMAREHLEKAGLAEYFVHSLGHGVGLDIHEAPGLRKTSEAVLESGQVVTVEPGVYIPGDTGCRVEDTVVVTEGSPDILNRFPKQSLDADSPPRLTS